MPQKNFMAKLEAFTIYAPFLLCIFSENKLILQFVSQETLIKNNYLGQKTLTNSFLSL